MAGYGYGNGDYSTYNEPERPRFEEYDSCEHVRRPLIVDREGRMRPLFQNAPPRRESLGKNMGMPVETDYKYSSPTSNYGEYRHYSNNNDDWNKPSGYGTMREESPYDGYRGNRNDRHPLDKPRNGMGELAADFLKEALKPSSGKASKEDTSYAGKIDSAAKRYAMEMVKNEVSSYTGKATNSREAKKKYNGSMI